MANYYYLNERGERKGPLSLENIKALRLAPATMVWREGMADWARADSLPELRTATAGGGISALRVVLIVFAVVGTLVFTLAGRFVAAFAASLVDARPSLPALILYYVGFRRSGGRQFLRGIAQRLWDLMPGHGATFRVIGGLTCGLVGLGVLVSLSGGTLLQDLVSIAVILLFGIFAFYTARVGEE